MASTALPLGIDIGGSGIKGAPVDLEKGAFATERLRIDTPEGASPGDVFDVVEQVAAHFDDVCGDSPIGVTVPAAVTHGVVRTAANIDGAWIGVDAQKKLSKRLGRPVTVLNDADAAGMAELAYGAAQGVDGTVFVATLGTGVGTVLLVDGVLVPNTELGHIELDGVDAETRTANAIRKAEDLSWEDWAKRLQRYFSAIENLLWPDLIVVGGGVSKKSEKFLPYLDLRAPIVPAKLLNDAGIIGAAWHATRVAEGLAK
ncbi:MAG: ROK family protein [Dermatophilus congolensis]|nr:ROK family protein [Dermatophilus congolensis]